MFWVFITQWTLYCLYYEFLSIFSCFTQKSILVRRKTHVDTQTKTEFGLNQAKPDWVIAELVRLKAHLPNASVRTLAHTFNRIHQHKRQMTVSKSYVYQQLLKHQHEILLKRQKIKQRPPYRYTKNQLWQVDITKVNQTRILGVIDCGSRACLNLTTLPNKKSITLLRCLLDLVELYGQPQTIRTDNEPCFTSRLMRFGMWFIGIKKQTTQLASPWQNGRIERFFGTLKNKIKQCVISQSYEQVALNEFRFWYNFVRPHQALNGATPTETWNNQTPNKHGNAVYFSA